jgi:hypothetical protein
MAKARTRSAESFRYILRADEGLPSEQQSVWIFNPVTGPERARLIDEATVTRVLVDGTREVLDRANQQARENVRAHLIAVENFPSDAPKPWPKSFGDQQTYLDMLDEAEILELHNELFTRSWLSAEAKNSLAPGPTSGSGAP